MAVPTPLNNSVAKCTTTDNKPYPDADPDGKLGICNYEDALFLDRTKFVVRCNVPNVPTFKTFPCRACVIGVLYLHSCFAVSYDGADDAGVVVLRCVWFCRSIATPSRIPQQQARRMPHCSCFTRRTLCTYQAESNFRNSRGGGHWWSWSDLCDGNRLLLPPHPYPRPQAPQHCHPECTLSFPNYADGLCAIWIGRHTQSNNPPPQKKGTSLCKCQSINTTSLSSSLSRGGGGTTQW